MSKDTSIRQVYVQHEGKLITVEELKVLYDDKKITVNAFRKAMGFEELPEQFEETWRPQNQNKRAEILQHAEKLINGDRADIYGPPEVSFGRIADLWSAMGFSMREGNGLKVSYRKPDAIDVALALVQLKVSRTIGAPDHEDNWLDMAGYTALGAEMALRDKTHK